MDRRLTRPKDIGLFAGLFFFCRSAPATLIICIYHHPAVYLAADSMSSAPTNGIAITPSNSIATIHTKVFQIGPTSCGAMCGLAGGFNDSVDPNKTVNLADAFAQICNETFLSGNKEDNVAMVLRRFSSYYDLFLRTLEEASKTNANILGPKEKIPYTEILTAGYDPRRGSLFATSYRFSVTNKPITEPLFERDLTNKEGQISLAGETAFLSALLQSNEEKYLKLRSPEFNAVSSTIWDSNAPISDEAMTQFILDMFRLHQKHANTMGLSSGRIGEPYIIYKITRKGTERLR